MITPDELLACSTVVAMPVGDDRTTDHGQIALFTISREHVDNVCITRDGLGLSVQDRPAAALVPLRSPREVLPCPHGRKPYRPRSRLKTHHVRVHTATP